MIEGLVDLQVNGHDGVDFSSPALTLDDARRAVQGLLAAGTSTLLPTVVTAPWSLYARNLPILAALCESPDLGPHVPGIHLEGPFLCPAEGARGAHAPELMRDPDGDLLARLVELARGRVALLTQAAGLPGDEALCRRARSLGVAVSLGHHLATRDDLLRLRDAGATALTHFGNGLPNQLARTRNPLWAGLSVDGLDAMIITDGHHVPEEFVRVVLQVKGPGGVVLVSDATSLTGSAPGPHRTLGRDVVVEPDGRVFDPARGCLVGSATTLRGCVETLRRWQIVADDALPGLARDNARRLLRTSGGG